MKKIYTFIISIICIGMICGAFYYITSKSKNSAQDNEELTVVQKIITKDIEADYPATPREVVKLYNKIITCYYSAEFEEGEFDQLVDQAFLLFDDELVKNNPKENYVAALKNEIDEYKGKDKVISQSAVCSSNDVIYRKDKDNSEVAYVNTSYFIKEGKSYTRTYEQYVLRKDDDGNWKILGYYQLEANPSESEE